MTDMANYLLTLLGLAIVGFITGALYFQGLWWTLKGLPYKGGWTSRFLGSFALRAALVVTVFYLFMGDDWRRIFALTLGFLVARFLIIKKVRQTPGDKDKEPTP